MQSGCMAFCVLFVILVCNHFVCTAQHEGDFTASGSSVAQTSGSGSTDQAFSTKEDNITITVLGLFPYNFTGATLEALLQGDFAFGIVAYAAAQMALDDINNKTHDLLSGHNLKLISVNSECDVGSCLYSVAEEALRPNRPVIILGPHCNKPTEYVGEFVTVNSNVITVSYGSNTPELVDSEKYRGFFRTVPPKRELNKGVHTLLNRFRWERICLAVQGDNFNIKLSESLIQYLVKKSFNFTIIHSVTERNIQFLNGSFCRVFIIIADPVNYPYAVWFLELSGLTGAAYQTIFMGQFGASEINFCNASSCPPVNLVLKGSQSSISVHFSIENEKEEEKEELEEDNWKKNILHGTDFEAKLSAFLEELAIEYEFNASIVIENSDLVIAGAAYDAMWLIALGINASIEPLAEHGWTLEDYLPQSNAQVSQIIIDNFENVSFEGVYKKIDFTKQRHHPNVDVFISQFQGDAFVPIAIYPSDSDNVTWDNNSSFIWIGDEPPKDRPSVVNVTIPTWVGIFMMVLTIVGLILSGIFFTFNCYFRNRRLIKASSPHINNLIILGCVVGFLFITSFTLEGYYGIPESARTYFCNSSVLMVCSAFTLSFGALLVKTWRIYMIFRNPWAKHRIYKDYVLYIIVAVMLGVDLLIFCFLLGFGPLKSVEYRVFTTEYTYSIRLCEGQKFNGIFVGILIIYKILMLVFGVFLAIQSHKIKSKAFNDSKYIAMAIYGVVLIILIGLPISTFALLGNQLLWSFIAINVTVATCCSIILFTVFIPKVVILYKKRNETIRPLVTSKYNTESSTNTSHQHTNTRYRKMSYHVPAHRRTQNINVSLRRTKSDGFFNTKSSVVSSPLLSFEETTSTQQTIVLGNKRPSLTPNRWPPTMDIIAEEIESDNNST